MWLHTVYCYQMPLHTLDTPSVALALARFVSGGNGQKSCDLSFGVRQIFWVFHDRPVLSLESGWSGGVFSVFCTPFSLLYRREIFVTNLNSTLYMNTSLLLSFSVY